jgi:8-oxo-dGTP pyrophosphatase MutT (NUDIX family)
MTTIHERSAGVIPFRRAAGQGELLYLVLHSATVRNPRAKWEFPKGGMEPGETPRATAAREFQEETGLTDWSFREGFERSLSYTYIRRGRKVVKTVTYFVVEVADDSALTRSPEHVEDPFGHWCYWGGFAQVSRLLYHAKIRHVFTEADSWLRQEEAPPAAETATDSA